MAIAAVGVRRGSTTTSAPPRSSIDSRCATAGGIVSAMLEPTRRIASVSATSDSGNGSPRSTPNARFPAAAAEDMQNRPL